MSYKYILFDLDGTLTDPKEGITKAVQYALKKYDIYVEDLDLLEKFIGPPLKNSFREFYNFDEEKAVQAVSFYREYFKEKGMFENEVYENIENVLNKLQALGLNLIVATSKPTVFSKEILKHFNLEQYFIEVVGSNLDGTRSEKGEIIKFILEKYKITRLHEVVMIGDRKYDIIGATDNHIDSIGVTYGYGSEEELKNAKATYIANAVQDLLRCIINDR
jgi:phosphoglycolate phosphatase